MHFKPYDAFEIYRRYQPLLGYNFPKDTVAYRVDPFHAHCRAYGRDEESEEKARKTTTHAGGTAFKRRRRGRGGKDKKSSEEETLTRRQYAIPCHVYLVFRVEDDRILEERERQGIRVPNRLGIYQCRCLR